MNDENKLSEDVEEQIQSLASDVYIQIEDKLTHLITAVLGDSAHKNAAKDADYIALEKKFTAKHDKWQESKKLLENCRWSD